MGGVRSESKSQYRTRGKPTTKELEMYPGEERSAFGEVTREAEKVAPILGLQRTRNLLIDRRRNTDDCNRSRTAYISVKRGM